jgi:hypothetical protein
LAATGVSLEAGPPLEGPTKEAIAGVKALARSGKKLLTELAMFKPR